MLFYKYYIGKVFLRPKSIFCVSGRLWEGTLVSVGGNGEEGAKHRV